MNWFLLPLSDEDVLVTGERVLYRQRRHWAATLPEFAQFLAVLFLHSAFSMRTTTGMNEVLFLGTVIAVLVLLPLFTRARWETWHLVVVAIVIFWVLQSRVSIVGLTSLLVLLMGCRFLVRAVRWAFYQRTYLTDRRVMEVDGFLGIQVDSMPLTKVTDIMLRRTALGEVLGYGTFRVESAGQDQALSELKYLLYPEDFHDMVVAAPTWRAP